MSGPATVNQAFVRIDTSSMDDDQPVSTYRSWALQQNTQHLIDQFAQHRINWTSSDNDDALIVTRDTGTIHYWSHPFVHTWLTPTWPCGLDVHVYAQRAGGGTVTVEGRIVPANTKLFDISDEAYWEDDGSTSSSTPAEVINSIFYPDTTTFANAGWRSFNVLDANGDSHGVRVCISRLDLKITTSGGLSSSAYGVTRVLVREFC